MTAKFGYVTTACRLCKDIVPPDAVKENIVRKPARLDRLDVEYSIAAILFSTYHAEYLYCEKWEFSLVAICGAVPSMVRSVRLFSQCSHHYVNVYPNGTVMARSDANDLPNLTISTRGRSLELLIHSPIQDMYLCFKGGRLVGRRMTRSQAERQTNCLFKEEFVNGYNQYHLVKNENRYIGFNPRGLQLRRQKSRLQDRWHTCLSFLVEFGFDINRHNSKIAGGDVPKWRPQPRLRPPKLLPKAPCHGVRHHHNRHQRRRNCDGT